MKVIGTAGHVDHGKSTLVRALTGIDPDRLKEEKERQMTIDLGFAWMHLPGGEAVGIVDVPGHRDFIENMLAGVGGIDAALLVVDAEEGVMPQTREHVAILDLLEVERGVVALTKCDLVADPAWIQLVHDDVRRLLSTTALSQAPILPVSASNGTGLESLVAALESVLKQTPPRRSTGRARLPVDRAFTITGFGSIVTGTLIDGTLQVGDAVEVLPGRVQARIRGLQTHNEEIETALPGSRVAVNLAGVELSQVARGHVVAAPGSFLPSALIDVRFRLLQDASSPLEHDQEVKLFLGAAQSMARVRLLEVDRLRPGENGWLQLVLKEPVVAERGDHYILRRPSPSETLGGGRVAEPHPAGRHKLKDAAVTRSLAGLLEGTPKEALGHWLAARGPSWKAMTLREGGVEPAKAEEALTSLVEEARLRSIPSAGGGPRDSLLVESGVWESLTGRAEALIRGYHAEHPLHKGMPREELKSRMGLETSVFGRLLEAWTAEGRFASSGVDVRLPSFQAQLSPDQESKAEALMVEFAASPEAPPSLRQAGEAVGQGVLSFLLETGRLVQVAPDLAFDRDTYAAILERLEAEFKDHDTLTVAELRDRFKTSRKYALALLEHTDSIGITVREGDAHRLVRRTD